LFLLRASGVAAEVRAAITALGSRALSNCVCGVARTAAACASLLLFWTAFFFIKMISY